MLLRKAMAVALGASSALANGALDGQQIPLMRNGGDVNSFSGSSSSKRPNVVMILTDDQDMHMQSLDYMPLLKQHMMEQGIFYKRHFCTTAVCCPARVTLWTGRTAHNTNVTDVNPPHGTNL